MKSIQILSIILLSSCGAGFPFPPGLGPGPSPASGPGSGSDASGNYCIEKDIAYQIKAKAKITRTGEDDSTALKWKVDKIITLGCMDNNVYHVDTEKVLPAEDVYITVKTPSDSKAIHTDTNSEGIVSLDISDPQVRDYIQKSLPTLNFEIRIAGDQISKQKVSASKALCPKKMVTSVDGYYQKSVHEVPHQCHGTIIFGDDEIGVVHAFSIDAKEAAITALAKEELEQVKKSMSILKIDNFIKMFSGNPEAKAAKAILEEWLKKLQDEGENNFAKGLDHCKKIQKDITKMGKELEKMEEKELDNQAEVMALQVKTTLDELQQQEIYLQDIVLGFSKIDAPKASKLNSLLLKECSYMNFMDELETAEDVKDEKEIKQLIKQFPEMMRECTSLEKKARAFVKKILGVLKNLSKKPSQEKYNKAVAQVEGEGHSIQNEIGLLSSQIGDVIEATYEEDEMKAAKMQDEGNKSCTGMIEAADDIDDIEETLYDF